MLAGTGKLHDLKHNRCRKIDSSLASNTNGYGSDKGSTAQKVHHSFGRRRMGYSRSTDTSSRRPSSLILPLATEILLMGTLLMPSESDHNITHVALHRPAGKILIYHFDRSPRQASLSSSWSSISLIEIQADWPSPAIFNAPLEANEAAGLEEIPVESVISLLNGTFIWDFTNCTKLADKNLSLHDGNARPLLTVPSEKHTSSILFYNR